MKDFSEKELKCLKAILLNIKNGNKLNHNILLQNAENELDEQTYIKFVNILESKYLIIDFKRNTGVQGYSEGQKLPPKLSIEGEAMLEKLLNQPEE